MATTYTKESLREHSRYWAWKGNQEAGDNGNRLIDMEGGNNGNGIVIAAENESYIGNSAGCLLNGEAFHHDGYFHPAKKEDASNYKHQRPVAYVVGRRYRPVSGGDEYIFAQLNGKYLFINVRTGMSRFSFPYPLDWFNFNGWVEVE